MGNYTELVLKCRIKQDIPYEVDRILRFLFKFERSNFDKINLPDHNFFKKNTWEVIGVCSSYSHIPNSLSFYDGRYLFTRCDLKNYHQEIENFISWLLPYIDEEDGQFVGWVMDEFQKDPQLIYIGKDTTENDR